MAFLIYINEQQEIFLNKRPATGIWGGLWSFEECKDEASTIKKTIKAHNKNAKIIRRLDSFKHSFTHYNLWISPVLIESPGGSNNYFRKSSILKGVPAPVKKIIQAL